MSDMFSAVSPHPAPLTSTQLQQMVAIAKALFDLRHNQAYREAIFPEAPEITAFDPGHDSVMMGYDFHLTEQGPVLIEVNTNAGGSLLGWIAFARRFGHPEEMPTSVRARLLQTFAEEWRLFGGGGDCPDRIAVVDENPEEQHLFPEMEWFAELFRSWGVDCRVADPSELTFDGDALRLDGKRLDLVYNRHTDFYLNTPSMTAIKQAYLKQKICLTPNPHTYGLLADKRRLLRLADPAFRAQLALSPEAEAALAGGLLECRLLKDWDREALWAERKQYVFKPVAHFGGKGVLLGKSTSHKRFDELPPAETLVQRLAPPSLTAVEGDKPMKTDYRLFVYQDQVLRITARLYHGQLTNLRTEGGGFAPVDIVET